MIRPPPAVRADRRPWTGVGEPGRAPRKHTGALRRISADGGTVPRRRDKARRYPGDAFRVRTGRGLHGLRPGPPTRRPEEAVAHTRALEDAGAETLVMYAADWSYSTTAAWAALLSNRLPVILWTNARP